MLGNASWVVRVDRRMPLRRAEHDSVRPRHFDCGLRIFLGYPRREFQIVELDGGMNNMFPIDQLRAAGPNRKQRKSCRDAECVDHQCIAYSEHSLIPIKDRGLGV